MALRRCPRDSVCSGIITKIYLLHIVNSPGQLDGAEKVILAFSGDFDLERSSDINLSNCIKYLMNFDETTIYDSGCVRIFGGYCLIYLRSCESTLLR